jgi:hypothetical protein
MYVGGFIMATLLIISQDFDGYNVVWAVREYITRLLRAYFHEERPEKGHDQIDCVCCGVSRGWKWDDEKHIWQCELCGYTVPPGLHIISPGEVFSLMEHILAYGKQQLVADDLMNKRTIERFPFPKPAGEISISFGKNNGSS